MRKAALCGFALAMFLVTGCGDSHDKVMGDMLKTLNEMNDTLSKIKDEASAKDGEAKIQKLVDKMKEIKARGDKLGKPSEDVEKKLKEKYEKDIMAAAMKMMGAASNPEAAKVMAKFQKDLGEAMK